MCWIYHLINCLAAWNYHFGQGPISHWRGLSCCSPQANRSRLRSNSVLSREVYSLSKKPRVVSEALQSAQAAKVSTPSGDTSGIAYWILDNHIFTGVLWGHRMGKTMLSPISNSENMKWTAFAESAKIPASKTKMLSKDTWACPYSGWEAPQHSSQPLWTGWLTSLSRWMTAV